MFTSPFNPITGNGLGVSYSSLNQIGGIFPQKGIGQAGVQCFVNVVNGNLIIKDLMVKLMELNGSMELGFYFNTQVPSGSNNWQFAIKKLILPVNNQALTMQEGDGHLTSYTTSDNTTYTAPALNDGTPYLTKLNNNTWQWYHPKTQITEIFDTNGLLISRTNALGSTTTFIYDQYGNLTNINGPGGDTYQISRTSSSINIYDTSNGNNNLLQSYTLDSQGRITTTQTSDGYQINYFYDNNSNGSYLNKITQSDGTTIQFNNNVSPTFGNQITGFQLGGDVSYNFTFPTAQNPNLAIVTDGVGSTTQFTIDQNNRTTQITQQSGYDVVGSEIDITTIAYNPAGQVQTITKPEGQLSNQSTSYQYGLFGLIIQKTDPNGQVTQFNYYNDVNCAVPSYLISKTQIINGQNLTTYYIYDTNYNSNNNIFQRFVISPTGRVTEYTPDYYGNIQNVSQFFSVVFNTSSLNPTTPVPLQQLTNWVTQQFAQNLPQQASLVNYAYDIRGQIVSKIEYANTDGAGNGIDDAFASQEGNYWDEFGNLTQHEFLQIYPATTATTTQRFDGLQRLTKKVDALLEVTAYTYADAQSQIQTLYPNGSSDTKTLEPSGLISTDTAKAISNNQNQTRITTFTRDNAGYTIKTTLPDGNLLYTFYDRQNRLGIKITPAGIFSQTQYDRVHNYTATTTYANAIDTSKLINGTNPDILPVASLALSLLMPDPLNDRTTYQFKDASNRIIWEVDGKNYGTQYFYDALNRQIAKITYATQLSTAELTQLQQAQPFVRTPDFSQDRGIQYFYDNDNNKIGKLVSAGYKTATTTDTTGYITQYFRDSASRIYQITRYATRVALNLANTNLIQFIPVSDPVNDATTYIFRDARGNKIASVDAGGYLTLITNLPCGIPSQSIKYANKIAASWFSNPSTIPPTPASSTEDQTTIYDYDLLNRSIETVGAMNRADFIDYDVMGNKISLQTQDGNNLNSIDPACMRGTQTQFDGWNQKTAEANAFINQLLTAPNLTPQQIGQIWQTQSMQHTYDATGLKLFTVMPPRQNSKVNDIYYYYYDADRRPIVIVDPDGNVTVKTLNSFSEPTQIRLYANAISQQNLSTLTGGFVTAAFQVILNALQNAKDEITTNTYDQRGQITQIIDANNNSTTKTYTAFKQVATENLPVANQQPSLTITHQYEGRGYEIQTIKTGGTLTTTTSSQYLNLMGKKTQYTDELNTNYITQYDPLGRTIVKQEISTADNLTITTHTFTIDAFGRVFTDTDSLQQVTTHVYNQQNRTHNIIYPINAVTKLITLNIFNQKNQIVDSLGDTESWQYAPDGKITVYTDQLSNTTTDNFDLMGRNILHIDPNNTQTVQIYDGASNIIKKIADATGMSLATQYVPDAFGNNATIIDPKNITTTNIFDGNNNLIQSIIDPNNPGENYTGLNIIKVKTYNAQNLVASYTLGDATTNNQYYETDQIDSLNRPNGKIVDPNNLALVTAQHLDVAGEVIANIDANGNITRTFFDGLKRKRFVVDAAGGVYERNYDTENRLQYERHYDQGINPTTLSDSTTLQQLIGLVQTSAQDSYIYYFYDNNGNECFTVNSIGKVCQKSYDNAGRKIQDIIYATPNTTDVSTLTTSLLITWASQNILSTNQSTYHILDAKGQECFTINPNNIISQTVFDPNGNKITQVTYANAVNPAQIIVLSLNQILSNINQDSTRDSYFYRILDNLQRPIFEVDGEGNVTKHVYDSNNNETMLAKYAQKIVVPQTYANIIVACNALPAPNPAVDSITQKAWDNANRNTIITDPINNTDQFKLDASGNVKIHTDKNNQQWTNNFDGANRLTDQYTPQVPVTVVQAAPNNKLNLLNDNNDKIISSLLVQNIKPQYPIINLSGLGNDCALFALALAVKKAALKKPALQNSLLHWPLIAQINEINISKNPARNVKLGHYLRIALVKALMQDEEFKKQQWDNFISFCLKFIETKSFDTISALMATLIESNKIFIGQMQKAWQKKIKDNAQINNKSAFPAKIVQSFIELYINANGGWSDVYQRYCQFIQNNAVKLTLKEIGCLANYWRINLKIVSNNGDVYQNKQTPDVQASICNLDSQHWQVIDINAEPLNQRDAYNPNNLAYKVRTKDGVNNTVISSQILLTSTQSNQSVHKQFVLDNVGNKKQITEGYGTSQARIIINNFSPVNKLSGTTINNVSIDNPSLPASYQTRPETSTSVTTNILYNAKQKKVAEQNENGQWSFYIYDSEQREVYRISSSNVNSVITGYAVTQKVYDVFNNVIQEIAYYIPINLNVTQYSQTGIPLSVIQQAGVIVTSSNDRTVTKTFDNCNNTTSLQQGPIFYYLPNANNPTFGTNYMQTKFAYNAFNQCYLKSGLLNPVQNIWSQQLYWFDRTGKVIAECDPVYRVKIHKYDAFKNEIFRAEWGGQPSQLPTPVTAYTQLVAAYNWTAADRVFSYAYDVRQLKISETRAQQLTASTLGVIIQSLNLDNNNVPSLQNQTINGLTKSYTYTATLKLNSIKDEAGYMKYIFYDARNIVIATTDVPRTSVDKNNNSITLVPLTYTGNDLFGNSVTTTRFKQGTVPVTNPLQLPQPIATDPDDQTELKYFDARGLALWKQDADQNVTGITYTPTRKKARNFNQLTNKTAINIDDYRISYDALDRVILKIIYRNGTLQTDYQTQIQYDPFNQPIAEGPNDGTGVFPLYRKFDAVGNIWSTNKDGGVATIILTDLTGKVSLRGQSATQDLSQTNYSDLPNVMALGMDDLERLQSQRDNSGRVTIKNLPSFSIDDSFSSKNLPLTFIASDQYPQIGSYTLTWLHPHETLVEAIQVVLTATADSKQQYTLTIKSQDNNSILGADVSQIPSDVYNYEMKFYALDGLQQPYGPELYHAKGVVEFNNNNYSNSLSMVVEVQNGSSLLLSGYTRGITAVQLIQNNKQIAQVPVQSVPHSQDNFTVDVSSYASGVYAVEPVIPGKSNLPQSLPFTIYTSTPSPTPLAQEIPCQITLYTLYSDNGQRAQLAWTVPNQFNQLPVTMTCNYQDTSGNNQVQQVTITPGTNLGVYTDSKNNKLTCNNNFAFQISKISNVTVSLQLSANESIIIVNNFTPNNFAGNNTTVIQTNNFNNSIVQYVKPLTGFNSPPTISYLNTTCDRAANYVNLTAIQTNAQGIVLDTSVLPTGYFPFNVTIPSTQPVIVNCSFIISQGGLVFPGQDDIPNPPIVKNPFYQYSYDNWNNQLYQIDTLNNKTTYANNIYNKTTQVTQPPVDVLNEDGTTNTNINPVTTTGFDIRGNRIGVIKPNGNAVNNPMDNTEGFQLDEAAQMTADILADGTYADRNVFDALGRITIRITRVSGSDYQYILIYDHRNNVTQETYPTGPVWQYAYNEINRRYLQTDPMQQSINYDYDFNANISANYLPGGEVTTMEYDRNNKTIKIKYPTVDGNDNMSQAWYLDYFGDPLPQGDGTNKVPGHSDIAGVNYYYIYDFKKQVITKSSDTPSSVKQHGQYLVLTPSFNINSHQFQYSASTSPGSLKQSLSFTYQRGLIVQAIDYENNKVTLTSYDSENRRIAYSLWGSSTLSPQFLLRELNSEYDAIGREIVTIESQAKIEKFYDLNSNIRRQKIRAKVQNCSLDSDNWSTFDVADRVLIFNGIFDKNSNKIIISEGTGWQYTYKDGFRDTQTAISTSNVTETSTIKYDNDGRLSEIDTPADQNYFATYGYDKVGRLKDFTSHLNNAVLEYNHTVFNANGWVAGTAQSYTTVSTVSTGFSEFYPDGEAGSQTTKYVQSGIVDTLNNIQYVLFDDFQLSLMGGTRYVPNVGTSDYSSSQKYFDSNGIINAQSGINCSQAYNPSKYQLGTSVLITSYDGLILSRYELVGVNAEASTSLYNITQFIYDNANNAVAVYTVYYTGSTVTAITSTLSAGHRVNRYGTQLGGYNSQAFNGTIIGNPLTSTSSNTTNMPFTSPISNLIANSKIYNQLLLKNSLFQIQQTLAQTSLALDMVRPIDQSYPATGGASFYTVQPGDNLGYIAASQYGDATKATDIANANNISDGQVAAGQVLTIPPIINSRYQATSALPYAQFMNTVLMSMYPQFKFNPPKQHDGFLSEVVHGLVDLAAQIIGITIGTALGGPIGAAIGAAIATGLADAAYQELAVHEGWQPHFSLEESVTTGIEAGIEAYVMAPGGNFGLNAPVAVSSTASNVAVLSITDAIRNAGEIAVLDQLTEMALGERNKFDFNAVITAMATAAAMGPVGSAEQSLPIGQFPDDVVQNFTGNLIQSASYDTITGQTLYVDQIAASSLGATLGQYMGEEIINISKANESATNPANPGSQNGVNAQNNSMAGNNGLNSSSSSASGNISGSNNSSAAANNSASPGNNSNNSSANNYNNYQARQNPGRNNNGLFNSSSSANNSTYGSGNSTPTSKLSQDVLTALAVGDAEALANTPMNQLIPSISLPGSEPNLNTISTNKWQNFLTTITNDSGYVIGFSESLKNFINPYNLFNTAINATHLLGDIGKVSYNADYNSQAAIDISNCWNNIRNGFTNIYNQASLGNNSYVQNYARGQLLFMGTSIIIAPEYAGFLEDVSVTAAGQLGQAIGLAIPTANGYAFQSFNLQALLARSYVMDGGYVYRLGTTDLSTTLEAQFWALDNPATTTDFGSLYGIPQENIDNTNFTLSGIIKPNLNFITRIAPGVGSNVGGAIEVVSESNSINARSFSMN